jgi:hypothetical protein
MKKLISMTTITLLTLNFNLKAAEPNYSGSSAKTVWDTVSAAPYKEVPTNRVTFKSLFDGSVSLIQRSANRTLNDQRDLLPYFTKLAHPNGACLKGEWKITEQNIYSGLFKKDSKAIIIARASVAMNDIELGDQRGFGLAGKLFAAENDEMVVKTANFFLVDDLGGTKAAHYTDVEMTNEPKLSKTWTVIKNIRYALKLASTFKKEDSNPLKRQVYEIAEATRAPNESLKVPKWMMVKASPNLKKIDARDFRDEFNMDAHANLMNFEIYVADTQIKKSKNWKKIGEINFSESTISSGCDHELHFHHPKWRSDIE